MSWVKDFEERRDGKKPEKGEEELAGILLGKRRNLGSGVSFNQEDLLRYNYYRFLI